MKTTPQDKNKKDSKSKETIIVFPSASEYEDAISLGKQSFKTLDLEFEMSKPKMKMWTFGAGQFAVVFKGRMNGKDYAMRCFQHSTEKGLAKYSVLSDYLIEKKIDWLSSFVFYQNEIVIDEKEYPILLMDWVEGVDIHEFITDNLYSNYWLLELQKSLVALSADLEKKGIGHGDIQKGNVIVLKQNRKIILKLLDYDGMFVSSMSGDESTELGKPDLQHPKRDKKFFNKKMDRFSIWLIITALEALKYNKSLWDRISDGGFNDESNFIFSFNDLNNTTNSSVFSKLSQSSVQSVKDYSGLLKELCNKSINTIPSPIILDGMREETFIKSDLPPPETPPKKSSEKHKEQTDELENSKKTKQIKTKPTEPKKTGKQFDIDKRKTTSKTVKEKKGGREFDKKDKIDPTKLLRDVKFRNMFAGLFAMSLMLNMFLFFRYSDKMSDYSNQKKQYEQAYTSIQSLNKTIDVLESDLNNMTKLRNSWRSDYYTMQSNRDAWEADYYTMQLNRNSWQRDYYTMKEYKDGWEDNYNDLLVKWNNLVRRWNNL